ncbi:hypothetical protein IC575_013395 [Cucumis melo]
MENEESNNRCNLQLSLRPPFQSPPPPSPQSLFTLHSSFQSPPPSLQSLQSLLSLRLPTQSPTPPTQSSLSQHLSLQPPPSPPHERLLCVSPQPPHPPPPPEHPLSFHLLLESPPPPPSPAEFPSSLPLPLQSPPLPFDYLQPPPTQQTQNQPPEIPKPKRQTQNQPPEIPKPKRRRTQADNSRIEPPYPWSTEKGAVIHKLEYLEANNILTIKGEVKCKRCDRKDEIEYELISKFDEIRRFIEREKDNMHDRAPDRWVNPILLNCNFCNKEECVEPIISEANSNINWLFLLLGNFLGCLKLSQLKYFCTQTNIHRTGAKDRLIYLTYLALCKQLQPNSDQIFG